MILLYCTALAIVPMSRLHAACRLLCMRIRRCRYLWTPSLQTQASVATLTVDCFCQSHLGSAKDSRRTSLMDSSALVMSGGIKVIAFQLDFRIMTTAITSSYDFFLGGPYIDLLSRAQLLNCLSMTVNIIEIGSDSYCHRSIHLNFETENVTSLLERHSLAN